MSISSIQNTIKRFQNEIVSLRTKIASKRKDEATARDKAYKAYIAVIGAKTDSTRRSKMSEYDRETKKSISLTKDIADLEKCLSDKEKSLFSEQSKLAKEQADIETQRLKEVEKLHKGTSRKLQTLSNTVLSVQREQTKISSAFPLLQVRLDEAYDVFISHASEDKEPFVDALVEALENKGVKVWYDKHQIAWGCSIRQSIDEGLKKSKFGIVVLSKYYMSKYWTQKEFNALFAKESTYGKTILPIWHNISKDQVMSFSPMLLDLKALNSALLTISEIADIFIETLNYNINEG